MVYLFLAIICSSAIAIIFKYSEGNNMNRYAVTTSNYVMAFTVSLVMALMERNIYFSNDNVFKSFVEESKNVIIKNQGLFSNDSSIVWSIIIGSVAGVFFFLSFIYYQKSVKENSVGLAGAFSKLGILVPMSLSIILWNELPTKIQWVGIVLSMASILIVNLSFKKSNIEEIRFNLILLFLFGGMAEFSNKFFQKYAIDDYKSLFLFFVFFVAFIISLIFTIKRKQPVDKRDILTGFMVGIPNLFSSFFLIMALKPMKASVVYPIYSAGSIVVISLAGLLFFKEKLMRKEKVSIVMTIVALILINL
ncbi:SMR family transporter [Dethiothermospora halolimnae]|uniref:SMR family transporter n=1 Tax=Dethiothermospora halolimnae TaxID=3114390 RepID=UPI003CCBBD69